MDKNEVTTNFINVSFNLAMELLDKKENELTKAEKEFIDMINKFGNIIALNNIHK